MATRDADRRAVVEQLRREQQRKERRSTLLTIGAAVLIGAIIIGVAVWQLLKQSSSADAGPLPSIGVPRDEAGCQDVTTAAPKGKELSGSPANHIDVGTKVTYGSAPPAFGQHWGNFLQPGEVRTFWTVADRPQVERLVHSLEHGWTILWYDQSIADDDTQLQDLRAIADKFPTDQARAQKLMVAPWTAQDGKAFPGGAHLALTHWSTAGDATAPAQGIAPGQQGVWDYCGAVSGEVVATFIKQYPWSDAPEAGSF